MGANALVSATVVAVTLKEPQRGAKEEDLAEVLSKGEIQMLWLEGWKHDVVSGDGN